MSSRGDEWKKLRTASNPIIAKPKNVYYFLPSQNKIGNDFINIVHEKFGDSNSIVLNEFQETLKLLALECL